MMIMQKNRYVSTLWNVILCAILLAGFAGDCSATDVVDNSSGKSELNATLIVIGPIGAYGWAYEAHGGASKMAQRLPYVKFSEIENADAPNAPRILRECAENGSNLIFCHSYDFINAIKEVAPEYPDVIFMLGGGTEKLARNAGFYYERMYEAMYLTGIVAGNMTKTDKIAFAAALPTSQVINHLNAFAKGVASSNPKAKVYVEWIGNWYDPGKERAVALSLIHKGCDIITHASASDVTGQTADEMGTYFISSGSESGRFSSGIYLTGATWDMGPIMTDIVESVHNGTWDSRPGQEWAYGLAEGGVKLAPFGDNVPGNVRSFVDEKQKEIVQKELAIFPGMSDEDLNKMYYLEPNVVGELPKS
jgi:basic membrane protein A and related proteins